MKDDVHVLLRPLRGGRQLDLKTPLVPPGECSSWGTLSKTKQRCKKCKTSVFKHFKHQQLSFNRGKPRWRVNMFFGPSHRSDSSGDGPAAARASTVGASQRDGRRRATAAAVKSGKTHTRDAYGRASEDAPFREGTWRKNVEALIARSVKANTSLGRYLPNMNKWLSWVIEHGYKVTTWEDVDEAIAAYLSFKSDEDAVGPHIGDCVVHGMAWMYPESQGKLPRSARCLMGWHKNHIHGEGSAIPIEIIAVVEQRMRQDNNSVEADVVAVSLDCYLRSMEALGLRREDVVVAPSVQNDGTEELTLRLGVVERKEQTKTGYRQGVRVDSPYVMQLLKKRLLATEPGQKIFPCSKDAFSAAWRKAGLQLEVDLGPPHTLRHSGPSHDALTNYRSLWAIQRRGRWNSERSVLRYVKTHTLMEQRAKMPANLLSLGSSILKDRPERPNIARE
jgi:hypothetical protein